MSSIDLKWFEIGHFIAYIYCHLIYNTIKYKWFYPCGIMETLRERHNERYGVSNHRRIDCLLKRLFRHRSQKTSKVSVASLCEGNSPVNVWFPSQRASNADNVFIWWRHHRLTSKVSQCHTCWCHGPYRRQVINKNDAAYFCNSNNSLSNGRSWKTLDDVIKWKHFLRYWPFVRGIRRSPVNSHHKG